MKPMILNLNLDWRNFKIFSDLDGDDLYYKLSDIILGRVLNVDMEVKDDVEPTHKGDLVIDVIVVPIDLMYPTHLKLLDESRIALEKIIDSNYEIGSEEKKPRTNKTLAKQEFNKVFKQKRVTMKKRKKVIKKQLPYVKNDIDIIQKRIENKKFNLELKENEEFNLIKDMINKFKETHGYYPARILGDRIYQTRENKNICKALGRKIEENMEWISYLQN